MTNVNVKQFKTKVFTITSPDLFAERNIVDVFGKRYGVQLKFSFKNDVDAYISLKTDSNAAIYPSFVFDNFMQAQMLKCLMCRKCLISRH